MKSIVIKIDARIKSCGNCEYGGRPYHETACLLFLKLRKYDLYYERLPECISAEYGGKHV